MKMIILEHQGEYYFCQSANESSARLFGENEPYITFLKYLLLEEEPDENHNKHCYKYDEASEKHEGAREVF